MLKSFLNKVAGLRAPTLVFSYEICEFFKNTYFEEHVGTTAFINSFVSIAPFLYPLKTLENPTVF